MHPLAEQVLHGNSRAAARAITLIENDCPEKEQILKDLHPYAGKAYVVGITGAPGAGKSTLANALIAYLCRQGLKLGVIAVDPTSPFSGGAILGDRVRMQKHAADPNVFIRSMGTRGFLGGLARHTREAVRVLDAYGCEVILVETVGVGQSELDIMHLADSVAVVVSPGGGDEVQAFKAGIMEIADLFVINKADLDGADRLAAQISAMLDIAKQDAPWRPPVVKAVSAKQEGMEAIWQALRDHRAYLQAAGEWKRKREAHFRTEVEEIALQELSRRVRALLADPFFRREGMKAGAGEESPYALARKIVEAITGEGREDGDGD